MKFDIATAVSPDYLEVLRLCLPSWARNSGADRIRVYPIGAGDCKTKEERWYRQAFVRCQRMQEAVLDAVVQHRRLLFLDIDCLVLSPLDGGFSPAHPMSIARWPDINMGVLFFNTLLPFSWESFFAVITTRIAERCDYLISHPPKKWTPGDQDVWREMVQGREEDVCRLDENVWNFCYSAHEWHERLKEHRHGIKILHIKTRHFGLDTPIMDAIKREFADAI